jgi:hypothetical protein
MMVMKAIISLCGSFGSEQYADLTDLILLFGLLSSPFLLARVGELVVTLLDQSCQRAYDPTLLLMTS